MSHTYEAIPITDRVYWVGAIDWNIREFHGYATHRGTTYNAFLVLGERVTLIDTVKEPFVDEMLSRVASVVDPSKVEYIVSNHSEMDHSGGLPKAIAAMNPVKVIASPKGLEALQAHFHGLAVDVEKVGSGSQLDLGGLTLSFLETRMLHWPDSMFTYVPELELLFSQDGFGMHLASSERFADQLPEDILYREAAKYFANILLPFSPQVRRCLKQVAELKLPIKTVAPDHGPVFRRDPSWIVNLYDKWATQRPTTKAVIVFDTMWHSTAKMARAIEEGLRHGGAAPVQLAPLGSNHRSDVATELLDAGALIVGSPTLNNHLFPTVADMLAYVEGLRPRNLVGAGFGSYGWSGEAVRRIDEALERMKVQRVAESVKVKYVPNADALAQCRQLGEQIGQALSAGVTCAEEFVKNPGVEPRQV
jgi:flavorubredoxin